MRKLKKIDPKAAQSVESFATCTCNCGICKGCNIGSMGPHDDETGWAAISAMYGSGHVGS